MNLTDEQIVVLLELIDSYNNGKRLTNITANQEANLLEVVKDFDKGRRLTNLTGTSEISVHKLIADFQYGKRFSGLTESQEALLLEVIDAFQNGKRVNELPSIKTGNPFDLIVEVLDTDGESKQAKLAGLYPFIEEQCAYGIEWDTEVSSPMCTRIGNLAFHRTLPIQSQMRGCLLDDDGKVVEYLNANDWKASDRSGENGQVMVEIPAHYRIFESLGKKRRVKISELPLAGYHYVPKSYVSAYEASLDRAAGKLASVVNVAANFRGGDNTNWDGTYRSLLGRPVSNTTRANFRIAARKRGATGDTRWNINVYDLYKDVAWLYYIEYANFNSQDLFDARLDVNGYRQGGLGDGVTTLTTAEWNTLNGYRPFIPCGHTDDFGNASGETAYVVDLAADGSNKRTVYVPRYRGIENIFGHLNKITDGINIETKGTNLGETSKIYVSRDPSKFVDNAYTGYEMRGLAGRVEGFIKELVMGEFGEIIPLTAGGGSTTWMCDYFTPYNPAAAANELRGVQFGGRTDGPAGNASQSGIGYVEHVGGAGGASVCNGTRLCFIPTEAEVATE
jgi:hypothetical protein